MFASSHGVLDLLIVVMAQPVPSISYVAPGGSVINPTGWVYQICPRASAAGNQCPAGSSITSSYYGGIRLALQPGDQLKFRLVNQLPTVDSALLLHSVEDSNLTLNPTNIHTHGLIVEARAPTLSDPTFGDYIFLSIYNTANGMPVPQATHQHGSVVMSYADYRIDIPSNHPSGAFFFHPHLHGIAVNQLSGGLSGLISIGEVGNYAFGDILGLPFPESSVRHLVLKDMQVAAAGTYVFPSGTTTIPDGTVLTQEVQPMCTQLPATSDEVRQGSCPGAKISDNGSNDYTGSTWFFTVSGQQYPTIPITEPNGEIWRLTNASANLTYDLQLINDATGEPMITQLVSVDGVSINVPPSTAPGTVVQLAGGRFKVVTCPQSPPSGITSVPVCVTEFTMMPSSRAELWVTYRDASGHVVTPPKGATGTFKTVGITTGIKFQQWPAVDLAKVAFNQTGPRSLVAAALAVRGDALLSNLPTGVFFARVPYAKAAALPADCKPLAPGHRRRIFFGQVDVTGATSTDSGLGYEEIDQNGVVVPGTQVPVTAFDSAVTRVCLPLAAGQMPVHETWEIVNLSVEYHNFHIHQSKFSFIQPGAPRGGLLSDILNPELGAGIMEDNVPLPVATPTDPTNIVDNQGGYCTIDQWRNGQCPMTPIVLDIPFAELGAFVFHCHVLGHEDSGMMAKIVVAPAPPAPNTHDYNGDGKSDIAWRNTIGNTALWLMNGATTVSARGFGNTPAHWAVVGQRDFNGDGNYDLLWRDGSGNTAIWFLNGTQIVSTAGIGQVPQSWAVVATGDFNGDGKGDILWQDASGNLAMWLMDGASVLSSGGLGNVSANWSLVGTGDFDGDGRSDLLWRDSSGNTAIWFLNGVRVLSSASIGNVSTVWTVVGTGDFDGDGRSDIVWRDSVGNTSIWLMNGATVASSGGLGVTPTSWSIVQTGDYNADGKSDLLWRDGSGNNSMWFMNGTQVLSNAGVAAVSTNWSVQSVNAE